MGIASTSFMSASQYKMADWVVHNHGGNVLVFRERPEVPRANPSPRRES
jgi:hypothetical protein